MGKRKQQEANVTDQTQAGAQAAAATATKPKAVRVEYTVDYKQPTPKVTKKFWVGMLPDDDTKALFMTTDKPSHWRGKCAWYQNIGCAGTSFVAYSDVLVGRDANENPIRVRRPGCMIEADEDKIERIKAASVENFIRESRHADGSPKIGVGKGQMYSKNAQAAERDEFRFNPATDFPFAHYVYMVEIQDESEIPTMEEFFRNPPKSLLGE